MTTTQAVVTEQLRRPGGRSAVVQAQVRAALEQLVAEQGREQVTVPAVAERAGVSASSIYRRWGDLSGLLSETAVHRLDPNRPLADTGDLRQDLAAWALEFATHVARPGNRSLLKAAAALTGGEETDCLRNRKAEAATLVQRAQARGAWAPEPQQVVDHVIAPIVMRLLFGAAHAEPGLTQRLVDELFGLAGGAAAGAAKAPRKR
jgi:AcrR family transcriptional regulator